MATPKQMTPFQKKCHKLLLKNGWEFVRFTGSGHVLYQGMVNGKLQTTTIASSPRNPHMALRVVARYANIKL